MSLSSARKKIKRVLRIENHYVREFFSEFLATFVLISIGCGANAQSVLSRHESGKSLSVHLAWGFSVAMATYCALGVSGAHLNPAVSFAMLILGRKNLIQFILYSLAQYLGAFAGSAAVYGVYLEALNEYDGGQRSVVGENATAGIWGTYPQPYLSTMAGFGDQVFGSMMMLLSCVAIGDRYNMAPGFGFMPMCFGGVITVFNMTYTYNCGGAINPARDFGPRLFTACAGWGTEVFTAYNYWFWVPIVAPHVGTLCGAWMYLVLVGLHTEPDENYDIAGYVDDSISRMNSQSDIFLDSSTVNLVKY